MKATDKSLFITILLFTLGIILIGMTWFVPALIVRVIATVSLTILCGWMGIFGDAQISITAEHNKSIFKRIRERIRKEVKSEPWKVLDEEDLEKIFEEFDDEI